MFSRWYGDSATVEAAMNDKEKKRLGLLFLRVKRLGLGS